VYLGINAVKSLVLSSHLFALFDPKRYPGFSLSMLERHCLATGMLAKVIAAAEAQDKAIADQAFIAGMLHDVGKLLLAWGYQDGYPELLQTARRENKTLWTVEREQLGVTHAEAGAYLLGLWSFPGPVVDAVAFHHAPPAPINPGFSILAVTHVANLLDKELYVVNATYSRNQLDESYIEAAGLSRHLPLWREACARAYPDRSKV